MPKSGQKINYQIRPSKSVERKMMCELIRQIQIALGQTDFRYIGMGAKYFVDFVLFHNEFGITDMISIESDVDNRNRYEFNKPLKDIHMMFGDTTAVLPQITDFEKKMNIVWLDYDDAFKEEMLKDIITLSHRMDMGSVVFMSCNCSYGGTLPTEKKQSFKNALGIYFDDTLEDHHYTRNNIPIIIRDTVYTIIDEELRKLNQGTSTNKEALPLVFFTYKDSAPMMTIGLLFANPLIREIIEASELYRRLAYCNSRRDCKPFDIDVPKLTYKEMQLIMQNIPITECEYKQKKEDFHGIEYDEIKNFESLYRFMPYYFEGSINA